MSKLPKLKIRYPFGHPDKDTIELEQAEYRFRHGDEVQIMAEGQVEQAKYRFRYGDEVLVFVEGHLVNSYEELVQLASQDDYKDREFLEVVLLYAEIVGG